MFANYAKSLQQVLRWEGGKSDDSRDPGGRTAYGVTQRTYDAYRRRMSQAPRDVYQIDQDELESIYRNSYWNLIRGDDLPSGIDLAVFDFAVNSGPTRAVRELQKVLGVQSDGDVGNLTLSAARAREATGLINEYQDARLAFLRSLKTWGTFGKGWSNRVEGIRKAARGYAMGTKPLVEPQVLPDANRKADPRELKVTKTGAGKGAVITAAGTAGSVITDAAHQLAPMAGISTALQVVFVLLIIAGVGFTIYSVLQSIQRQGVA